MREFVCREILKGGALSGMYRWGRGGASRTPNIFKFACKLVII